MLGFPARTTVDSSTQRTLLIVAHPGHELFLHAWMEQNRPAVAVLTDGSGHNGHSRLPATAETVRQTNSRIAGLFGRFTDRGFRQALLMKDFDRFAALASEIADLIVFDRIDSVVAATAEGIDPGADVCRCITDAAIAIAGRNRPSIRNYQFSLQPPTNASVVARGVKSICVGVSPEAWQRKLRALIASPQLGAALRSSPQSDAGWQEESLLPATPWSMLRQADSAFDYSGVEASTPACPLFAEHVRPLAESLRLVAAGQRVAA